MKNALQKFGKFLSAMVMPNIGAFIAWGFITALFIPAGWIPNAALASIQPFMLHFLIPVLIAAQGGKMVGGDRGRVMGAVYYTMADFAFAVANNYDMEEGMTVTLTSQINFLDAARGKTLTAEAHVIRDGRNTTFYRVDVTDELGTQIATVSSNGFRIRKK